MIIHINCVFQKKISVTQCNLSNVSNAIKLLVTLNLALNTFYEEMNEKTYCTLLNVCISAIRAQIIRNNTSRLQEIFIKQLLFASVFLDFFLFAIYFCWRRAKLKKYMFFYKHGVFQSEARNSLGFSQIEPQNMLRICLS